MFTNVPANDTDRTGERAPVADLTTRHGLFRIHVFTDGATGSEHVALDDCRDYGFAASMLRRLGVRSVSLMTNNRDKISELSRAGVPVVARIPHVMEPGPLNHAYLDTEARRSGHLVYPSGMPGA